MNTSTPTQASLELRIEALESACEDLQRIVELAHEWSAKFPLGGAMDKEAANQIYTLCEALNLGPQAETTAPH